jgi:cell division septation protein DedD
MYMASTNRIYCGHTDWPNYSVFPSNTTFALNTWYYVALTFNTTDGMKLYVNGVLDSTYTANKSPVVGNYSTNVGAFGTGNLLNGRIARVFCYNTSLSASEVLQNYNGTLPPFISPTPTPTPTITQTSTPSVTTTPTNTQTPTTTETPTNTITPTPSITASQTPTQTPTTTPTPTQTEPFFILIQSGDILTAQDGSGIEYQH